MSFWGAAISLVGGAILGSRSNSRNRRSQRAAQQAGDRRSLSNALENQALTAQNASIIRGVAGLNAAGIIEVGAMNRDFILRSRDRNVDLMRIEQKESLRRHINEEVEAAGQVRIGFSSSGISASSGSALAVRLVEMTKGRVDREYQDMVTNKQILGFFETETERAAITYREAELGAAAALANAEAEATVATNEAQAAVNNARRNLAESGG